MSVMHYTDFNLAQLHNELSRYQKMPIHLWWMATEAERPAQ
jgi:hypothetical protein